MFGFLPGPSFCCGKSASLYRAHFCGLCNGLHRDYGVWARWLINRDSTFLALLGSALSPAAPATCRTTCCNPWGRPHELLDAGASVHYAAAVTLCGLTTKLDDDAGDERGVRRWLAQAGGRLLDDAAGRALGVLHGLKFPVAEVQAAMRGQNLAEQKGCFGDLRSAAESTCSAFGEIVARVPGAGAAQGAALRTLGRELGFLIYAKDAWDDWAKDRRRGRFNALQHLVSENDRRAVLAPMLQSSLSALRQAFDALTLHRHRDLLSMVLVEGAGRRVQEVLTSREDAEREHRERRRWGKGDKERLPRQDRKRDDCCSSCDCCDCRFCGDTCPKACQGSRGGGGNHCCDCNPCDGDGCGCCGCDCG